MNTKKSPLLFALGCGILFAAGALAQASKIEFPAPSPAATVKQRVGLTDVEIVYSRPGVKGREIFGGLVPYGQVWRTGANQATKVTFSTPVKLDGCDIPAGTYALMTIPGKDEWTIVINKNADQWGAYKYDEKQDLVRFKVKPIVLQKPVETFTIALDQLHDDSSIIDLDWDRTEVPIKLQVEYVDKLVSQIDSMMASDAKEKPYFRAAQYYYNHGLDLQKAKTWVDAALAEKETANAVYVKAEILAKLGNKEGAMAAAKHSSELASKASDADLVKLNAALISSLK